MHTRTHAIQDGDERQSGFAATVRCHRAPCAQHVLVQAGLTPLALRPHLCRVHTDDRQRRTNELSVALASTRQNTTLRSPRLSLGPRLTPRCFFVCGSLCPTRPTIDPRHLGRSAAPSPLTLHSSRSHLSSTPALQRRFRAGARAAMRAQTRTWWKTFSNVRTRSTCWMNSSPSRGLQYWHTTLSAAPRTDTAQQRAIVSDGGVPTDAAEMRRHKDHRTDRLAGRTGRQTQTDTPADRGQAAAGRGSAAPHRRAGAGPCSRRSAPSSSQTAQARGRFSGARRAQHRAAPRHAPPPGRPLPVSRP
jgi:hypothetical protein